MSGVQHNFKWFFVSVTVFFFSNINSSVKLRGTVVQWGNVSSKNTYNYDCISKIQVFDIWFIPSVEYKIGFWFNLVSFSS
jgi:hypothetical protein